MRECGTCTLCCYFMDVPEYKSPIESYCPNCQINIGCKIYSERKEICQSFGCLWWHEKSMPEYLRPDNCGVLIEILPNNIFLAFIDPENKLALKNRANYILFDKCVKAGHPIVVYSGKDKSLLYFLPDGVIQENVKNKLVKLAFNRGF